MEKSNYLNEEKYQNTKMKIRNIALVVLIVGLLIGGSLIFTGIKKNLDASAQSQNTSEIKTKIEILDEELIQLKLKKDEEFAKNGSSTETFYRLSNEISDKSSELSELESELWRMEHAGDAKDYRLHSIGAVVILLGCTISGALYFMTKGREMMAYTTQQAMPISKEATEEMTPTIAKAAGKIAKEVSENIKK